MKKQSNGLSVAAKFRNSAGSFREKKEFKQDIRKEIEEQRQGEEVKSIRIIIAGSRTFNNYNLLKEKVDEIVKRFKGDIEIVSGTASGADKLGEKYAKEKNFPVKQFPADWNNINVEGAVVRVNNYENKYNAKAGHDRNLKMAEYASQADEGILIAFTKGTPGTANMILNAKKYRLRIYKEEI